MVPGHEIVGTVAGGGSKVTKFKQGDLVGVGCIADADGTCAECLADREECCPNLSYVFNSPDRHTGGTTFGGFSKNLVIDERCVLRVPATLDPAAAAPLRRHHHLFAPAPLESRPGQSRRHRRAGSFDFILDTVSGEHDLNAALWLLKRDGTVTLVGLPPKPLSIGAFPLIVGRKRCSISAPSTPSPPTSNCCPFSR